MPKINQNADKNEQQRLLYAQQKDRINVRRRLLYENRNNPTTSSTSLPTSNALPTIQTNPSHIHQIQYNPPLNEEHRRFRERIDGLSTMHVCTICKESYPGMKTKLFHGKISCFCCASSKSTNRFFELNSMNPGEQPYVLQQLTQVEEMLIARVNPFYRSLMLMVVNTNIVAIQLASLKTSPLLPNTYLEFFLT